MMNEQVLSLHPNFRTARMFCEFLGEIKIRRSVHIFEQTFPFLPELWVCHGSLMGLLKFNETIKQGLRNVLSAKLTETRGEDRRLRCRTGGEWFGVIGVPNRLGGLACAFR